MFKNFSVEHKRTRTVALVFGVGYLIFCSLCLALQLLTLFPRYASFGSQTYTDDAGKKHYCDFGSDPSKCQLSQIATFFMFVFGTNQSFMGVIFYFANWVFLVLWLVGIVLSIVMVVRRTRRSAVVLPPSSSDLEAAAAEEERKSNINRTYGTRVEVI